MTTTENPLFNPWEHLQSTLMQTYNKTVREEFADVEDDDNFATPRSSLKLACLIKDSDSAIISLVRMLYFHGTVKGGRDFWPDIYGIPCTSFQIQMSFIPQIQLYFQEHISEVAEGYAPITAEVSFRIMSETTETLTEAKLTILANRIKSIFGGATPFRWRKGKYRFNYTEKSKGYALQILAFSEAEAKDVIRAILQVQSHSPDWKYLTQSAAVNITEVYPTVPERKVILGKSRKLPRKRPVGTVRFIHAVAHIEGIQNPIVLYDPQRIFKKALID